MLLFKQILSFLVSVILFRFTYSLDQFYQKIIHNTDPQARCLDGTPGFVYMHQGTLKNKFLIYFQGGGLCIGFTVAQTLQNCYNRSKTHLGSSALWPNSTNYNGYLSTNPSNQYSKWTKVVFGYCDGSLHQGKRKQPILYKDKQLYFRGATIVKSHFKWLIQQLNLDDAQQVILTGESAGGVATYLWGNYLNQLLNNKERFYIVPDSGGFLEYKAMESGQNLLSLVIQNMYRLSNTDEQAPTKQCVKNYPGFQWKCLFLKECFKYIQPKMLFLNSQYDSWAINNTLQIKCLKGGVSGQTLKFCNEEELQYIEKYRLEYLTLAKQIVSVDKNGIWSISCSHHGYAYEQGFYDNQNQRIPQNIGKTVKQALQMFRSGQKTNFIDQKGWPSNSRCAY